MGGVISGGKSLVIPSSLRDKEMGRAKANTSLIKIVISLNKVKEKIKTLREAISFFTWSL